MTQGENTRRIVYNITSCCLRKGSDADLPNAGKAHTAVLTNKRQCGIKTLLGCERQERFEVNDEAETVLSKEDGQPWWRGEGEGGWVVEENWEADPGDA